MFLLSRPINLTHVTFRLQLLLKVLYTPLTLPSILDLPTGGYTEKQITFDSHQHSYTMQPVPQTIQHQTILFKHSYKKWSNICISTAQVVVILTHIWEAPGSNLGWDKHYPDRGFVVFLSLSRKMLE